MDLPASFAFEGVLEGVVDATACEGPPAAPAEAKQEHTRILRVMLAVDDCIAYWRAPEIGAASERVRAAFDGRWFASVGFTIARLRHITVRRHVTVRRRTFDRWSLSAE